MTSTRKQSLMIQILATALGHHLRRFLLIAAGLVGGSVAPDVAQAAGTYTVKATCGGAWEKDNRFPQIAVFEACPKLVLRNVIGNFKTPNGSTGAWVFTAPPGTTLEGATLEGKMQCGKSWRVAVGTDSGRIVYGCLSGGFGTSIPGEYVSFVGPTGPQAPSTKLVLGISCADGDGCPNTGTTPRGYGELSRAEVVVRDPEPPRTLIVGGPLAGGGWYGSMTSINLAGADNTGIRRFDVAVDGRAEYGQQIDMPCDIGKARPCTDHDNVGVPVDLRGLPDGQHTVAGQAFDSAENLAESAPQTINVDNTPPVAVKDAKLVGGSGFRSRNRFSLTWRNAPQQFAPIAGANYALCPEGPAKGSPGCVGGSAAGPDLSRIEGIKVPGPGPWTAYVWSYDAAGNADPAQAVKVGGLRLLVRRATAGRDRRGTRLTAGRRKGKRRLVSRPTLKLGRRATIRGRLTVGRGKRKRGIEGQRLLVYKRVRVQGARYRRAGSVVTGKRGRYRYRTGAGPSRRLQFVYPGNARRAGTVGKVSLRVRARLRLRVDRRAVQNGEAVQLRGRLRGGKVPPQGALLELQVFVGGQWRPFATPRSDRRGRFAFPYRFQTVTSTASFKFRAVLRRQPTYPFTGRSRAVRVRVQGV